MGVLKPFWGIFGILVVFGALARGAHDLWAATLVYLLVLCSGLAYLLRTHLPKKSPGVYIGFGVPLLALVVPLLLFGLGPPYVYKRNEYHAHHFLYDHHHGHLHPFRSHLDVPSD